MVAISKRLFEIMDELDANDNYRREHKLIPRMPGYKEAMAEHDRIYHEYLLEAQRIGFIELAVPIV